MNGDVLNNPLKIIRWFLGPLFWWVQPKPFPKDPNEHLNLDPAVPVLYVLPIRSWIDLWILDRYCRKFALPRPSYSASKLRISTTGAYLYLTKMGWLQVRRAKSAPAPLANIVKRAKKDDNFDLQIVPVSIIWGRNPGHQNSSFLKYLFEDDENAGVFQRLVIVLVQGRDAIIHFGKPIRLQEQAKSEQSAEQVARKMRRVLRVHFQQQRRATLGPSLYSRDDIVGPLVRSRNIQDAIDQEVKKKKQDRHKVESRAANYIREISAEPRHGAVRLLSAFLKYVFNRIFSGVLVVNESRPRDLSEKYNIVFLSAHRSHVDYLLLGFVLFNCGMVPPHMAAGVNLNFWPIGPLLRRAGAFFLRRSFRGDRLYAACFNEYVHFVTSQGYSLNFFPEGGRSRTGKLLAPKTGMLAMIVNSYVRDSSKPLAIVPVYIGYDNVVEVKTYAKELQGRKKEKESIGLLLKARRILQVDFGKAYVNFGEPMILGDFLDQRYPQWKDRQEDVGASKPNWVHAAVNSIADEAMEKINEIAIVSPTALIGLAVLSTPQRAVAEEDLLRFLKIAVDILPEQQLRTLPVQEPKQMIDWAEQKSHLQRFTYAGGDVLHLSESDAVSMSYYRNNILHHYALPSLIANYFAYQNEVDVEDLKEGCELLFPFLRAELFLVAEAQDVRGIVDDVVASLVHSEVLSWDESRSRLRRPSAASAEFSVLRMLGNSAKVVLDRYGISLAVLSQYQDEGRVRRARFEDQCFMMAQRISLLNGALEADYYDKKLYQKFVEMMRKHQYVEFIDDGDLKIFPKASRLTSAAANLVSADIWQSIQRTANQTEADV